MKNKKNPKPDMAKLLTATRILVEIFKVRDVLSKVKHELEKQIDLTRKIDSQLSEEMNFHWQVMDVLRMSMGPKPLPHALAVKRWLKKQKRQ